MNIETLPPDDSSALNEDIVASIDDNLFSRLYGQDYGIGAALNGSIPDITFCGRGSQTRLLKLPEPTGDGILSIGMPYQGWTFEGVELVGNANLWRTTGTSHYFTVCLSGTRNVRFNRCTFRDLVGALQIRDSSDITFVDCDFYGTIPGVVESGVIDPPAVPGAVFTSGVSINEQVRHVTFDRCRFHFCETGIGVATQSFQSSHNVTVRNCTFRADWWDNPYPVLRWQTSTVALTQGYHVTIAGGASALVPGQVVSFRRQVSTGQAFSRIYAGQVEATGTPFVDAHVGDVIETFDGKRARIGAIQSEQSVWVDGWEYIDTYEPTTPPDMATPWRLSRYYACGIGSVVSDTEFVLYFEPVDPFTGERAISDLGLDIGTMPGKVMARTLYSGIHTHGGLDGLLVDGCLFYGGWADQCSVHYTSGVRIIGSSFRYGQDEGITLTGCPRPVVTGCDFLNCGVSAMFLGGGQGASLTGNTILNWGITNPYGPGIDGGGVGTAITGNTFARSQNVRRADWCRWAIGLRLGDCTGTIISANPDTGSTISTLDVDLLAAPTIGAITARNLSRGLTGEGKDNVQQEPSGKPGLPGEPGPIGPPGPPAPVAIIKRMESTAAIPKGKYGVTVEHNLGAAPCMEDVGVVCAKAYVWLTGVTGNTLTFRTEAAPKEPLAFRFSARLS
jgi:hypothetical protein